MTIDNEAADENSSPDNAIFSPHCISLHATDSKNEVLNSYNTLQLAIHIICQSKRCSMLSWLSK